MSDRRPKVVGCASEQVAEAEERVKNSPKLFLTREAARRLHNGGGGETERPASTLMSNRDEEKILKMKTDGVGSLLAWLRSSRVILDDDSAADQRNCGGRTEHTKQMRRRSL